MVVGDHLVRHGLCSIRDLARFCETTSLPRAASARRAAAYVRERVDSAMETRLRMLLVLAGLPERETNLVLRDVDGIPIRRNDLSYPSARAAIE